MSDNIALQHVIENFKNAVPNGVLSSENRGRAHSALSTIFAVVGDKTPESWEIVSQEIGAGYEAALEELRPDLARFVPKRPLQFCPDNTNEVPVITGDVAVDQFLQGSTGFIQGRKPETVYLTGDLPTPGPANTL